MGKILTINEGIINGEVEQPESSMGCFTSEDTHLVSALTITDHDREKLVVQVKDLRGTDMIVPAVSGHIDALRSMLGQWLNHKNVDGYIRDELTRESYEELGNVASYLGIRPDKIRREYVLRDREIDSKAMNHLTKTYSHSVNSRVLKQSILDKIFTSVEEHGANETIKRLLVLDRHDIQLILAQEGVMVDIKGNQTFLYPPMREYLNRFIIN